MRAEAKTLQKVLALLARAAHPHTPEEEARTSAIIAARMIFASGLQIGASAEPPSKTSPSPPPRCPKPYRVFTSRFDGWCKSCGEPFDIGDRVAWVKGRGCTHYECRGFWEDGTR